MLVNCQYLFYVCSVTQQVLRRKNLMKIALQDKVSDIINDDKYSKDYSSDMEKCWSPFRVQKISGVVGIVSPGLGVSLL